MAAIAAIAAATFTVIAVYEPPAKPDVVSGRAKPKVTSSGERQRWWSRDVVIQVDPSMSSLGPNAEEAVALAFGSWLSSSPYVPRLTFDTHPGQSASDEPDGENRVYFAPIRVPGHEDDLAVTLAFADDRTGEILEADIIINSEHHFALIEPEPQRRNGGDADDRDDRKGDDGEDRRAQGAEASHGEAEDDALVVQAEELRAPATCRDDYDVESIVAHEAGHFFGLSEDVNDSSATMFFSTPPCDLRKRTLGADDTAVLSALYATGPPEPEEQSAAACSMSSARAGAVHASPGCLAAIALWLGVRRRAGRGDPRTSS